MKVRLANQLEIAVWGSRCSAFIPLNDAKTVVLIDDNDDTIAETTEERLAITFSHEGLHMVVDEIAGFEASRTMDRITNFNRHHSTICGRMAQDGFSGIGRVSRGPRGGVGRPTIDHQILAFIPVSHP